MSYNVVLLLDHTPRCLRCHGNNRSRSASLFTMTAYSRGLEEWRKDRDTDALGLDDLFPRSNVNKLQKDIQNIPLQFWLKTN